LWIQQDGIVAAHTDAAQTHIKNNYMRSPLSDGCFHEEICTLLKKKIKSSLVTVDDLSIRFEYEGEVTLQDSEEILQRITAVHTRILNAAASTKIPSEKRLCCYLPKFSALILWVRAGFFSTECLADRR